MTSQFSPKVSEILAYSREEALRLSSSSVKPEHLLLGMMRIDNGAVYDVFNRMNIKKEDVKYSLESSGERWHHTFPKHTGSAAQRAGQQHPEVGSTGSPSAAR